MIKTFNFYISIRVIFFICLCASCSSCIEATLIVKPFPKKNPFSYVFPASLTKIKGIFRKFFFTANLNGDHLPLSTELKNEKVRLSEYGEEIFKNPKYRNDILLYNSFLWESKIYSSEDMPIHYYAEFLLHFVEISPNKTKVKVITYYPKIKVALGGTHPFPFPPSVFKDVEPSSIEEYLILLTIGHYLKVKNMPKMKLPNNEEAKITFEPVLKLDRN